MRRSNRRRPSRGVAAMLVVALLSALVSGIAAVREARSGPRPAGDASAPVDGYPQRIGFDRPSPDLPDRPGALAATLYDNAFGTGRPLGVTSRGGLWELVRGPTFCPRTAPSS